MDEKKLGRQAALALRDWTKEQLELPPGLMTRRVLEEGADFTQSSRRVNQETPIPEVACGAGVYASLGLTAGNTYSGGLGGWINMDPWADAGSWSLEHLRAGSLKITCGGQEYTATSVTAAAGVDDAVDAVFDFQTPGGSEVTVTLSSIYIQYGSLYGQAEMAVNSLGSDAGQSLYHSNIGFVLDPHTDIRPLGCELALAFARPLNDAEECGVLLSLLYSMYDGYGVVVDESLPGSLRLHAAAGADAVSLQYIRVGEGRFDLMDCAAIVEWEDGELRVIVADNGNLRFDAVHCERLVKTETAGEVA